MKKKYLTAIITSLIVIAGICLPIFASDGYEVLTEKPTDLTGIKWVGNDTLTNTKFLYYEESYKSYKNYNINFTAPEAGSLWDTEFTTFGWQSSGPPEPLDYTPYGSGWEDETTKTIIITSGDDVTNSELIDYLWSNGTMYGIVQPEQPQESLITRILRFIFGIGKTNNLANEPIIPGHNYSLGTLTYHTVAFNNNGHGTAPESQMVREGYKVSQPSDLSEDGWIFNGWFSDKNCTSEFDFNSEIEESKTLYAGWEQDIVPGLYDANDNLLCSWEDSGIDVESDYTSSTYNTNTTSPYYVMKNTYPNTTKVIIPKGITTIGDCAFYWCSFLTSIIIPEGVTSISDYAFYWCMESTSITIPESVTSIGNGAFWGCKSLTSVTIPEGVTSIKNDVFNNCSSLTSITIPEGVTSIGYNAFMDCSKLTSITIPNSVISLDSHAFHMSGGYNGISIICNGVTYNNKIEQSTNITLANGTVTTIYLYAVCLTAGTQIQYDLEGHTKNVEDFKIGDDIVSYNGKTHKLYIAKVKQVFVHDDVGRATQLVDMKLEDGTTLTMTPSHPILTSNGYKAVSNGNYQSLSVGDKAITINGEVKIIELNIRNVEPTITYNIDVVDVDEIIDDNTYDCYIANGVVSHNRPK